MLVVKKNCKNSLFKIFERYKIFVGYVYLSLFIIGKKEIEQISR